MRMEETPGRRAADATAATRSVQAAEPGRDGRKTDAVESWPPVAIGLGANLGDPVTTLGSAVRALRELLDELRVASVYRTEALSPFPQPDYFNTVVVARCPLPPEALLAVAKCLEWTSGRRLASRDASRFLDIDLLLYGKLVLRRPELTLPHPRLRERAFVLHPLAEVAPDWPLPPDGRTAGELLADGEGRGRVERLTGQRL